MASDSSENGSREARWRRRARSRDARVAIAERPGALREPARSDNGGGSNGSAPELPQIGGDDSRRRPRLKKLRMALVLLGLSVLAFASWIFGIMMAVAQDLPALENRSQYQNAQNSIVTDRNGTKLATLTNNEGRILLESNEIAPTMKEAVVAVEDQRFYEHRGIDPTGILRAIKEDVLSGSAEQGASTITQQFVKNALAAQQSRTVLQKLREAALAYHLERQWSKDKILTEYLNSIYFGEGAYGIEAAARTYFGWAHPGCGRDGAESCASQLVAWEAATLAGMIASPAAYSPRANRDAALDRRNLVLQNMSDQGYITPEEFTEYSQTNLPTESQIEPPQEQSAAPYFTSWLRQQVVDKYGAGEAFGGGLEVKSTLDLDLQREVEGIVTSRLSGIEPTSSLAVIENSTGSVLAMVGGPDYEKAPFNLATQGRRQPGSSFKPFTLITALEAGRSSSEVFTSKPKQFPFTARVKEDGKEKDLPDIFKVNNYEDNYLGSASIFDATTFSDNSVYAELGLQVGVGNVAQTAQKLGIETPLETSTKYSIQDGPFQPYNPALVLGGLETGVTPLEMAHAYNTIAEDGRRTSGTLAASENGPVAILGVKDEEGEFVDTEDGESGENRVRTEQVIPVPVAQETRSILETVVDEGTGDNAQTGGYVWGKTGTTDDNGDAWFCGATQEITVCVWVGHADSVTPMETEFAGAPVDGGTYPALIFSDVVSAYEALYGEDEPEETAAPTAPVAPEPVAPAPEPVPEETAAPEAAPAPAAPPETGQGGAGAE
jgi:penicillin-binding protein 1A